MSEPFLLIVAGPNGAGKTTLTQHLRKSDVDLGEYINPDEIAAELSGSLTERSKQAQQIADIRRDDCIKVRRSFTFETVMSHPSKIDILVRAKEAGYKIILYFVGTDDPQTNVERVALRVSLGGHSVPDEKVRGRWFRTMRLLHEAIRSSDQSYIFDNSTAGKIETIPRLVFHRTASRTGRLPQYELVGTPPAWVTRFVLEPLGVNFFDNYGSTRRGSNVGSIVSFPAELGIQREAQSETIATIADAGRQPIPHDIEAEQRVLAAIMANADAFRELSDLIEPKHMFEPIHQTIFEAAGNLIRGGRSANLADLQSVLPVGTNLAGLMTLGRYLEHIAAMEVAFPKVLEDSQTVRELAIRREVVDFGRTIASAAVEVGAGKASNLIELARSRLADLEASQEIRSEPTLPLQAPTTHGLHQFSKALVDAIGSAARAISGTGYGIETGLRDVDRKIAGLQPSELIVLASRPGMGKTALATNIAYNVARSWTGEQAGNDTPYKGGIVGFFSLEMSAEQIATRVISQQSGVPITDIRRGRINERDFYLIRDRSIEFQTLPLFIDETTALSIGQLVSRAHKLKSDRGLDLLIVDNLELLRAAARTGAGNEKANTRQITRELKKLAKDLGIPILLLAQLPSKADKRYQDKRPRLEDFSDKGAVEQDSDIVIFLHRDDFFLFKEEPMPGTYDYTNWLREIELAFGRAELIVAKQRNGETGSIYLHFNSSNGSFSDLEA
ncbi:DnaB-like helicase C-terminal domain-containing protein [Bradyrhizobium sp. CIAT3101]|uniref:DnaB-like helicase C-terminal domain-containing protein n=1 Tax=Bradyrhizobium sp. CIAT3101 TaxID=439387 RepID=UPI0024B1016B|nr:DnaB-like helicase C-terminal domain-containing protein [Bradyrhizobium sp. CIAT3101]WFU82639.1 DnaB-like helicase C-terminal domain-containing protein [Bradyrhizobium sp. CIAT3101]